MQRDKPNNSKRLAWNFHQTFIPERRFINAILHFAAEAREGNIQEIAQATGIPTGLSSGKVGPTIDYCRGMGLIALPIERSSIKRPILTPFGRTVLLYDPFLKVSITQWIAHLNLCSENIGAELWYQTFWKGSFRLGKIYKRDDLETWLSNICDLKTARLLGPMIRMYQEEASFSKCAALLENGKELTRQSMPIKNEYSWGYAAWILDTVERIVEHGAQATISQLEDACGWLTLTGWSETDSMQVLELIQRKGAFQIDRNMKPWIIKAQTSAAEAWRQLYSDIL